MDLGLSGKRALITGASKGIGKAIAARLIAEGVSVAICARHPDELGVAVDELKEGGKCWGAPCDISDPEANDRWIDDAVRALGGCDLFVANASALALGSEEADWEASFSVDLMGAVRGANRLIPVMAEAGGGAMLFISSVAALETFLMPAAYNALKAALITYASQLSQAVAPQNIRVNCVSPGAIEFPGGTWDHARREMPDLYQATVAKQPTGRLGSPEEVADAVAFLLSDRANWITGENLVVDGGYTSRVAF
ncbi:MAG TPA: SDR family NAD(P)-dependent oxidoreductase [Sphingomicrobium sp.]